MDGKALFTVEEVAEVGRAGGAVGPRGLRPRLDRWQRVLLTVRFRRPNLQLTVAARQPT